VAIQEGCAPMRFTSETASDGVCERLFVLDGITGVLWQPAGATGTRPLVLLGHGGGGGHARPLAGWARRLTACGFAVAAIDMPGCGGRTRSEADERALADLHKRIAAGGEQVLPLIARSNAELANRVVPEWRAVLDALNEFAGGPIGYWGVSLGSTIGIPLVAAEPRITAAVLGIASGENLMEPAAKITVPVQFLLQWDDEHVPRDSGLALFDAFASREKTLHANPGRHAEIPAFELDSSERFFARHLSPAASSTT
jgi:dienelactone hydrolase